MARDEEEFELVLGNKQLLSLFFLVVALFAVFFSFGYTVGYSRGQKDQPPTVAAVKPIEEPSSALRLPDALLEETPKPAALGQSEETTAAPALEQVPASPKSASEETEPTAEPRAEPQQLDQQGERPQSPPAPGSAVSGAAMARSIHLQVAALRVRADAQMLVNQLEAKGYPAAVYDQGADGLSRVLVGPFPDIESAKNYQKKLNEDGLDSLLRRPQ